MSPALSLGVRALSQTTDRSGGRAGIASMRGVNLAMYTTLRRTSAAFAMLAEYYLEGQTYSRSIMLSVAFMVLGALVAGLHDAEFDLYSYAMVFMANICTSIYLCVVARYGRSSGLNTLGLGTRASVLSMPPCVC